MTVDLAGALSTLLTWWLTLAVTAWLLVAMGAGWLADQRGRSPYIWFLVGLLGGPFAVLLVGLAPQGASRAYGRCRECHEPVRREAEKCPFCHAAAPTEQAP